MCHISYLRPKFLLTFKFLKSQLFNTLSNILDMGETLLFDDVFNANCPEFDTNNIHHHSQF